MPVTVRSPYTDDETRTKTISKLVEDFIRENWDAVRTGVDAEHETEGVAFGFYGNKIMQSGKPITLRAYNVFENITRMDVYGQRRMYMETVIVDIYVLNNDLDDSRDPRAIAIMKWLEELFVIHEGDSYKGIYEMFHRGARIEPDPVKSNITRVKATVEVRYILDKVVT